MRLGPSAAAVAAALLLLALPVQAQDGASSVSFDGVGFSFDQALGTNVDIRQVPGQPTDLQQPSGPDVPHTAFTLYGARSEDARAPRPIDAPGVVRAYRIADIAGYDTASQQLDQLKTLLADRPDLGGYMVVASDGGSDPLPFLPIVGAGQVIRARAQYLDTSQVSGVAYVTAFRQDVFPFAASDFRYTFQGLSADGAWYVSVDFDVDATMFPSKVSMKDYDRIVKRYAAYLNQSIQTLNAGAADAFTPALTSIDALVRSITFEAVPASEPTALPSGTIQPTASPAS